MTPTLKQLILDVETGNQNARHRLIIRIFPELRDMFDGRRLWGQDLIERLSTVCAKFLTKEEVDLGGGNVDVIEVFKRQVFLRAIDQLRKSKAVKHGGQVLARNDNSNAIDINEQPDQCPGPEADMIFTDSLQWALSQLDPEEQSILLALFDKNGSQTAAAEILGLSRSKVFRSQLRIRERLTKRGFQKE